ALAVASHLGHGHDVDAELGRLQDLADAVPGDDLEAVVHHLFATTGLRGDRLSYYDPANSMLPLVLDRRRGIPLTLAIIAVDVARRRQIPATVVGMPGHVLIGDGDPPDRWVDGFAGGEWLDALGARARFAAVHGRHAPFDPRYLQAAPHASVLARLLTNLVGIFSSSGDARLLVRVHELRAAIPGLGERERSQRAAALTSVGRFSEAAELWDSEVASRGGDEAEAAGAQARQLRANLN
nr:hypothetical protein [Acidimicrobiia bacterium]